MSFQKATKKQAKLRLALEGPAGFGKTYSALSVASYLAGDQRIAALDTEAKSMSKYADLFDFDVLECEPPFHPDKVTTAIQEAAAGGYGVVIVDSLSHFWTGEGGLLEIVDTVARTKYRNDSHRAWKDAGEIQQRLIDAILRSPIHVIAAMRTKKDYVRDEEEKDGRTRTRIRAAGTKVIQREDFDYEFDIVGRFEVPTVLTILKSRCALLPPETIVDKPGFDFARTLGDWLGSGEAVPLATKPQLKKIEALIGECATLAGKDVAEIKGRIQTTGMTKTEADATVEKLEAWKQQLTPEPAPAEAAA